MAQVITQDDLNQPGRPGVIQAGQQGQPPVAGTGAPTTGGRQTGGAQQGTITSYNPNQQRGSGYTNIQKIIQANVANRLGQTIGGGIQQQAGQLGQQVGQAEQQFQQQSGKGTGTTAEQQEVQQVLASPEQYSAGLGTYAATQPGQQFQQWITGQYTGPQQLARASQLQAQASDIGQLTKSLGTAGGQQGVLQRFVGTPQYTQGQQGLDVLLLGQTGGADLAAARRAALQQQAQTTGALTGAQQAAQQYGQQAQAFGQNIQQQLGQTLTTQEQGLQQQAQSAQAKRDAQIAAIQQQLQSGQITADEAQMLGVQAGQMTYNIDPTKFLTTSTLKATEQNIASAQDYARMQALQQLAGASAGQTAQDVLNKFTGQQEQAGKFAAEKAYTFDQPGYSQALGAAQQQYQSQLSPVQGRLSEAQKFVRWSTGQLNDQDIAQARAMGFSDKDIQQSPGYVGQSLWGQQYAGRGGNAGTVNAGWAAGQLQQAQQAYNQTMSALQQAYGTGTFSIAAPTPSPDQTQQAQASALQQAGAIPIAPNIGATS